MQKLTQPELKALCTKARSKVSLGQVYQHHKGGYYVARDIALSAHDLEPQVVYAPVGHEGVINFQRPLAEFIAKFKRHPL